MISSFLLLSRASLGKYLIVQLCAISKDASYLVSSCEVNNDIVLIDIEELIANMLEIIILFLRR